MLDIPTTEEFRLIIQEQIAPLYLLIQQMQQPQVDVDEIGKGAEYASKIIKKAVPTVYKLCNERILPHSKQGKDLYFKKSELLAWLNTGKRKTVSELQAQIN